MPTHPRDTCVLPGPSALWGGARTSLWLLPSSACSLLPLPCASRACSWCPLVATHGLDVQPVTSTRLALQLSQFIFLGVLLHICPT